MEKFKNKESNTNDGNTAPEGRTFVHWRVRLNESNKDKKKDNDDDEDESSDEQKSNSESIVDCSFGFR